MLKYKQLSPSFIQPRV